MTDLSAGFVHSVTFDVYDNTLFESFVAAVLADLEHPDLHDQHIESCLRVLQRFENAYQKELAKRLAKAQLDDEQFRLRHARAKTRLVRRLARHPCLPATAWWVLMPYAPHGISRNPGWVFQQAADPALLSAWFLHTSRLSTSTHTLDLVIARMPTHARAEYIAPIWASLLGNKHLSPDGWDRGLRFMHTTDKAIALVRAWWIQSAHEPKLHDCLHLPQVARLRALRGHGAYAAVYAGGRIGHDSVQIDVPGQTSFSLPCGHNWTRDLFQELSNVRFDYAVGRFRPLLEPIYYDARAWWNERIVKPSLPWWQ